MNNEAQDQQFSDEVFKLVRGYLAQATPEQLHIYVAWTNYDANEHIDWFIDNPNVDRATILFLYFQLGAPYFVQYKDIDDVLSQNGDEKTYRQLLLIEDRYKNNFYTGHGIYHDLNCGIGIKLGDYPDVEIKRPIPDFMLETVMGDIYVDIEEPPVDYEEGLPMEIEEKIDALYHQIFTKQ